MGKYMRKSKISSDVKAMELPQTPCTIRTRAKTLALQKSQDSNHPDDDLGKSYLELRNRRLEKTNILGKNKKLGNNKKTPQVNFLDFGLGNPRSPGFVGSEPIGDGNEQVDENNVDADARDRTTRESTPPSLIKGSDVVSTPPGSSTRRTGYAFSHRRIWNSVKDMPITHEVDELFASSEQEQTQYFTEKYNFDFANERPLPGRYEWVRV